MVLKRLVREGGQPMTEKDILFGEDHRLAGLVYPFSSSLEIPGFQSMVDRLKHKPILFIPVRGAQVQPRNGCGRQRLSEAGLQQAGEQVMVAKPALAAKDNEDIRRWRAWRIVCPGSLDDAQLRIQALQDRSLQQNDWISSPWRWRYRPGIRQYNGCR
jgi:hypothetical protein